MRLIVLLLLSAGWTVAGTADIGKTALVGNVNVREAFNRPVGTFTVDVTYGRLLNENFSRSQPMTQHLVCGDESGPHPELSTSGLVVAFECGSGVTIRVGNDTRTFFCES